jgi:hypothetical protein
MAATAAASEQRAGTAAVAFGRIGAGTVDGTTLPIHLLVFESAAVTTGGRLSHDSSEHNAWRM